MRDWRAWHDHYDDPTTSLFQRLRVVRARLDALLDSFGTGRPRLLALCAGDARDVLLVLRSRTDGAHVAAVLIEQDAVLAGRARAAADAAGLDQVEVRCADAGDARSFRDVLPVDVLMLCGIFGNVERSTVQHIVQRVPTMVTSGGFVIWTRGRRDSDDRRPEVRRWFIDAGMPEVSFDGPPAAYGVGVNRIETSRPCDIREPRLFSFTPDRRPSATRR